MANFMKLLHRIASRLSIVGEVLSFFWQRKLWWLLPMLILLLIFAVFVVLGQSTPLGPFIYALF